MKTTLQFIISLLFLALTTLSHAQSWTQLTTTGSSPTTRYGHTAVYDNANNRMIIFGGWDGDYLNDAWVISNANGLDSTTATWTQLSPTGSAPTTRYAHTAVYDTTNNRMIIMGGVNNLATLDDNVWILSNANGLGGTPTWSQLPSTQGTHKSDHTAVYDNTNNRMTVYGGFGSAGNEIYVLRNANGLDSTASTWQYIDATPDALYGTPTGRNLHTAIYDPVNNRMTIFGGETSISGGFLNDVWVLSNANGLDSTPSAWTQLLPTGGSPSTRAAHTAVYDAVKNRMIIFGGYGGDSIFALNDAWILTHANGLGGTPVWTQLFPTGSNSTTARYRQTAVYDSTNNRMTIYAGGNYGTYLNDVWILDNADTVPIKDWMLYSTKPDNSLIRQRQ